MWKWRTRKGWYKKCYAFETVYMKSRDLFPLYTFFKKEPKKLYQKAKTQENIIKIKYVHYTLAHFKITQFTVHQRLGFFSKISMVSISMFKLHNISNTTFPTCPIVINANLWIITHTIISLGPSAKVIYK